MIRAHAYLVFLAATILTILLFFSSSALGTLATLSLVAAQVCVTVYSKSIRRFFVVSIAILAVLIIVAILHPHPESLGFTIFDVFLFLQIFSWPMLRFEEKVFVRLVMPLVLINLLNMAFWVPIVSGGAYGLLIVALDAYGYFSKHNA